MSRRRIDPYKSKNYFVRRYFWSRVRKSLALATVTSKRVLDAGCGSGPLAEVIPANCELLLELDHSPILLEAKNRCNSIHSLRADCVNADLSALPFRNDIFDTIFAISVLEHQEDAGLACKEMHRVLHSGGELVVGLPTENSFYKFARRFIGFTKPLMHKGPEAIESDLKTLFHTEYSGGIPSKFPRFLQLYLTSKFRKAASQYLK